jgi:hypothetical protein
MTPSIARVFLFLMDSFRAAKLLNYRSAHILALFFFRFNEFVVVVFYSGFHELIELDGRFAAYSKTLFSVDSIQMDRELQSQEFNDKLNNSISSFLRLLSSYIMLTPAHQALEYLVRRYK